MAGVIATGPDRPAQAQFAVWGTQATVATTDRAAIAEAESLLREELHAVDLACSRFRSDSEISQVNRAGGNPVRLSPLLAGLVAAALRVAEATGGAVDPTVGSALVRLGYDRDFAEITAGGGAVAEPVPAPGWSCVELDTAGLKLRVPEGVSLDLGATAKAFAADRAASKIAAVVGAGVLINLGGDIALAGPPPPGGWAIGLASDCATAPEQADAVVALHQGGLASSGTAVRTWQRAGRRLHHIVDPRTGDSAAACWRLVSVAARSCLEANASSTAAIVWGPHALERLGTTGLPCRLVRQDGEVTTLGGWPAVRDPGRHRSGVGV